MSVSPDRIVTKVRPYGNNVSKPVTRGGSTRSLQAQAGDELLFQFKHGRIDLSTLNLRFTYVTVGPNSNDSVPPPDLLIRELEVRVGDTVLNRIRNYDQLMSIIWVYGSKLDWLFDKNSFANQHTAGRTINGTSAVGKRFTMNRFLGFLDQEAIIDTRELGGPLSIRLVLGGDTSVAQSVTSNTWGMDDIHFLTTYVDDSSAGVVTTSPNRMAWDDFTCISSSFPGYQSDTRLIVDSWGGGATLQYMLAKQVTLANLTTKTTTHDTTSGLVRSFNTTGNNLAAWNFTVNNKVVMDEDGDLADFLPSLKRVWPRGTMWPTGGGGANFLDAVNNKQCAFGAALNIPQPPGEQVEVSFYSTPTTAGAADPQTTFLWAKSSRKWM
jgi:hypothetical protein